MKKLLAQSRAAMAMKKAKIHFLVLLALVFYASSSSSSNKQRHVFVSSLAVSSRSSRGGVSAAARGMRIRQTITSSSSSSSSTVALHVASQTAATSPATLDSSSRLSDVLGARPPKPQLRKGTFADSLSKLSSTMMTTSVETLLARLEKQDLIQPLDQQWWPVATVSSLSKDTPNAVQVLGQSLVLFYDQPNDTWKCLQDMCTHRFAPLSGGRVVVSTATDNSSATDCRIQCRNHEWEFDASGVCRKGPPPPPNNSTNPVRAVTPFPAQIGAGMVWVYMGENIEDASINANNNNNKTKKSALSSPLPISPLLQKWHDQFGDDACFMRDLPVGMELVAENLLDLARMPFSLHNVGGLDRSQATPIEMQLLTPPTEPINKNSIKEQGSTAAATPTFQAKVLDAAETDPVYRSMKIQIPQNASVILSFYAPNHIRIHRDRGKGVSSSTEVFLCPLSRGRTRVFYYNTFETALNTPTDDDTKNQPTYTFVPQVTHKKSLARKILEWAIPALQRTVLNPTSVRYHMFAHGIFDGDGAILQQQGERKREWELQSNDYGSPSSADIMVLAVAAYLKRAGEVTTEANTSGKKTTTVESILASDASNLRYGTHFGKPILLDRQSHTNNCRVCQAALQEKQLWYDQLAVYQTALVGAAGASTCFAFLLATIAPMFKQTTVLLKVVASAAVTALAAALGIHHWKQRVFSNLQAFFFQDYHGKQQGDSDKNRRAIQVAKRG